MFENLSNTVLIAKFTAKRSSLERDLGVRGPGGLWGILTLHGGVAHLRWRVVDLQGPLPCRPLPPAVDGHELPALEAFIGVVKHPATVMPHTKKCDFEMLHFIRKGRWVEILN